MVPLPPYIRKGVESTGDRGRYQTVYAEVPGSVAAPTAGLHFTPDVFDRLDRRGIGRVDVTLHVGIGTFRPIEVERIDDHVLHAESGRAGPRRRRDPESSESRRGPDRRRRDDLDPGPGGGLEIRPIRAVLGRRRRSTSSPATSSGASTRS